MRIKKFLNREFIYKILVLTFIIFLLYYDYEKYSVLFRDRDFNSDFTLFYKVGLNFLNGESLYQTTFKYGFDDYYYGNYYLYPPFFACIFSFFTFISYDVLYRIFLIVNFVLLFFIIYWLKELVLGKEEKRFLLIPILWILVVSSCSFYSTQCQGQVNILVLAAIVASIFYEVKDKHIIAGFCFAVACYIKMSPIIFILPLLKFQKWCMIKSFFISTILITVVIALISPQGWGVYIDFFQNISTNINEIDGRNISLNFSKVIAENIGIISPLIIKTLTVLFFILITFRIKWAWSDDFVKLSSIYIFAMLTISPILWIHHFVWMIFPFAVLAAKLLNEKKYFTCLILYIFLLTPMELTDFI